MTKKYIENPKTHLAKKSSYASFLLEIGCFLSKLFTFSKSLHVDRTFSVNFTVQQGVFVKHYAPGGNKVQKDIFSFKVKVKVTRSLTLVTIERMSLMEYTCHI